jgi:hypothetical protein
MIYFLVLVVNLILKIVKVVKEVVEDFFQAISNLKSLFKRFFLYLPNNISKTTFLLSTKNNNTEKYNDKAPPVFKF